jgi:hypothetical protein
METTTTEETSNMKKSDITPNTIYRVRGSERYGTTPIGFDKFVLTGDEIVGVADDSGYWGRDKTTKRYVEVYPINWDSPRYDPTGQYVAATDTKQIAFKDIDGDYGEQGTLDDITAEQRDRLTQDIQRNLEFNAQVEVNKTRWAALDTATLDLLNVGEYDRPGSWNEFSNSLTSGWGNEGAGTVKVTLTLDAIETINALLATQAVAA